MNLIFWRRWFRWAQSALLTLARRGDFLALATFSNEFGTTVEAAVVPFESLAACFRGNWLAVAGRLFAWGKNNPDPLSTFRHDAEALQTKWTAVVNAVPAAPAPPPATDAAPAPPPANG